MATNFRNQTLLDSSFSHDLHGEPTRCTTQHTSPAPSLTLHNKSRPSDSLRWTPELRMKAAVFWLPRLCSNHQESLQARWVLFSKMQSTNSFSWTWWKTCIGRTSDVFKSTDGGAQAPLAVSICLVSLLGGSVLSSLPSLWHLWDTNSCLVRGITSSSKLFLTLYSHSPSMWLTILELIWVMTNRIRYWNHVLLAVS